jgi:curved DNA-binding protein CbpA
MKGDNPYEILGVTYDVSEEDLKKIYRKLALKHHPDRQTKEHDKEKAHDDFAKIAAAYDTLTDPVKLYDWRLAKEKAQAKATKKAPTPRKVPRRQNTMPVQRPSHCKNDERRNRDRGRSASPKKKKGNLPPPPSGAFSVLRRMSKSRPTKEHREKQAGKGAGNPTESSRTSPSTSTDAGAPSPFRSLSQSRAGRRASGLSASEHVSSTSASQPHTGPRAGRRASLLSTSEHLGSPTSQGLRSRASVCLPLSSPVAGTTTQGPSKKASMQPIPSPPMVGPTRASNHSLSTPTKTAINRYAAVAPSPQGRHQSCAKGVACPPTDKVAAPQGLVGTTPSSSSQARAEVQKKHTMPSAPVQKHTFRSKTYAGSPAEKISTPQGLNKRRASFQNTLSSYPVNSIGQGNATLPSTKNQGKPTNSSVLVHKQALSSKTFPGPATETDSTPQGINRRASLQKSLSSYPVTNLGQTNTRSPPVLHRRGSLAPTTLFGGSEHVPSTGSRCSDGGVPQAVFPKLKDEMLKDALGVKAQRTTSMAEGARSDSCHDPYEVFQEKLKEHFEEDYRQVDWKSEFRRKSIRVLQAKSRGNPNDPRTVVSMTTTTRKAQRADSSELYDIKTVTKLMKLNGTVQKISQASIVEKDVFNTVHADTITITREHALSKQAKK